MVAPSQSLKVKYAELKAKTHYSFLMGASSPEELVQKAAQLGLEAIGIADLNGVYGIPKAYQAKKAHPKLKLIVGAEIRVRMPLRGDMQGESLLTLHARDRKAYGLLCRLLTAAHADKPKGEAYVEWKEFTDFLSRPQSKGWIALPSHLGCGSESKEIVSKDHHLYWGALRDALGDQVFIPLGRFRDGNDRKRTETALALKRHYGAEIVAINDVHAHAHSRHLLQDVMTSIRVGKPLKDAGFHLFSNGERYLKSAEQMMKLFMDMPDAVSRTVDVAALCSFCPSELKYRYPSEWIPEGLSAIEYLTKLTWEGARKRYPQGIPETVQALLHKELALIDQLGFSDYFLTIYEIVDFARGRGILCQGRGSAANSAVCYCLGITAVDPARSNLLFERFISSERGEPPDIDVDFEHERREEVIQHIYEKYGRDRAAMVSAVVTYRRRSAFREIAKALGVDVGTLSAKELQVRFGELSKSSGVEDCEKKVEELSLEMEGFPRHLSIHSGGFTLSADPIVEIVPVEPARMEGRTIIQWDKYDLDYLGLLKVDVLALGMLSALKESLTRIGKELHEIPADDRATYDMIQRCDTVGTFQIESRAQMSMIGRLKPANFYDLVVEVAIMRPGPIVGKMVHPYLRRRRGQEKVIYPDPRLEKILGRTLGIPIFQEQVMSMAIELAGFTAGEADELRRAIGAWRSTGSVEKMGFRLMDGLTKNGLSAEYASQVFDQIQGFSMYGFPESHAASFALLAYASAWIKCHHQAEFTCALINSQPMGFYASHTLLDDAKRHGVEVLPVDPNLSDWNCDVIRLENELGNERKAIRLGFRVVHGLGKAEAEKLIEERKRRGPYRSLSDFLSRTRLKSAVLQGLALGNAFSKFGENQRQTLWKILELRMLSETGTQLSLFQSSYEVESGEAASGIALRPLSALESIQEDYAAFGLSTQGHPMRELRQKLRCQTIAWTKNNAPGGRTVSAAGLVIVRQKPPTAKGMTFATLEDESGFMDLAFHPEVYEKYREEFLRHCFIEVKGILQRDGNSMSLLVKHLKPLFQEAAKEEGWAPEASQFFNPMRARV
ncbi:MAG: error-prone DNA polymerase [Bdellovibrionia bacterium]